MLPLVGPVPFIFSFSRINPSYAADSFFLCSEKVGVKDEADNDL